MTYDKNNIFAKILRGEIPLKPDEKIYENEFVLSFYDINPKKKIHALVIPKGEYTDLDDFSKREPHIFINPKIVKESGNTVSEEGCLSVIDFRCEIQRFEKITLDYQDLNSDQQNCNHYYPKTLQNFYLLNHL